MLAMIAHMETTTALLCERAFLGALDGDCRTPLAGYAMVANGEVNFTGLVLTPDGGQSHAISDAGPAADAGAIGTRAAIRIRDMAGGDFFKSWG